MGRSASEAAGTFGPAFAASLITILREGIEVILLLSMLVALAVKTGEGPARSRACGRSAGAWRWRSSPALARPGG